MIAYVYKPKRRANGKVETQHTYRGRYRLQGEFSVSDVTLDTADKQVAHTRLMALIQDKEREKAGLTAPASERQAVAKSHPHPFAGLSCRSDSPGPDERIHAPRQEPG